MLRRTAVPGLRGPLGRHGSLRFSLTGSVGFVALGTEGGDAVRTVEGLDATATQDRLALEVSRLVGAVVVANMRRTRFPVSSAYSHQALLREVALHLDSS